MYSQCKDVQCVLVPRERMRPDGTRDFSPRAAREPA